MNLGVIEAHLLPGVQRMVGKQGRVLAGPPLYSAATGIRAEVWVHAARFEDRDGVTLDGVRTARRPLRLPSGVRGFEEERPALIVLEVTCTGPTLASVQWLCGAIPPVVLPVLETMPHPELSSLPNGSVALRFANFTAALSGVEVSHRAVGDATFFAGLLTFRLNGFLHVRVARRGGLARLTADTAEGTGEASTRRRLTLSVVQGRPGQDVRGEHVLITNTDRQAVPLGGFVLHDGAPKRPNRFALPAITLAPGASIRIWTRKGRNDSSNLFWGRAKSVWNTAIDRATLLDAGGVEVARASYPEHLERDR
jgi:hypothetical protein